jgi:PEP-CTERM motif
MQRWRWAVLVGLAVIVPTTARAAVIMYATAGGSTLDGQPIAASATFTTSNGGLTLLLENSVSDPVSVIQNISGIQFTVSGATAGSVTSSTGTPRTIANDGTFADAAAGTTDWLFSFGGGTFNLTALGANGPDQTIIGAPGGTNVYSNANGSIAGNNPHNPFLAAQATFVLASLGVTEQSTVSNVILLFGTGPTAVIAECRNGCTPTQPLPSTAPEPTSMLLFGSGLVGVALRRLRRGRLA